MQNEEWCRHAVRRGRNVELDEDDRVVGCLRLELPTGEVLQAPFLSQRVPQQFVRPVAAPKWKPLGQAPKPLQSLSGEKVAEVGLIGSHVA
jgi:hypothetical protein